VNLCSFSGKLVRGSMKGPYAGMAGIQVKRSSSSFLMLLEKLI
jgi:hypothetical protein